MASDEREMEQTGYKHECENSHDCVNFLKNCNSKREIDDLQENWNYKTFSAFHYLLTNPEFKILKHEFV